MGVGGWAGGGALAPLLRPCRRRTQLACPPACLPPRPKVVLAQDERQGGAPVAIKMVPRGEYLRAHRTYVKRELVYHASLQASRSSPPLSRLQRHCLWPGPADHATGRRGRGAAPGARAHAPAPLFPPRSTRLL